ncbi:hypothetical protein BDN72DRAFT_826596 [Pluteus cervinus]|uniref:Uncharacterized protein n=1 Tax=Pluteus cervinus TaxID=181527 RepID=A0ACD3AC46_9AGAR|nr:hypothetical protein BDN72DRAFT_826596 [Pluteus cervinus]
MSFLIRLFKKKPEEDYETVLASLAKNIEQRQKQLSEIRLRERRATLLVTLYTLTSWVAYVTLWYLNLLPKFLGHHKSAQLQKVLMISPVLVGPIVILFVRRIVQIWYQRIGNAEEKVLQDLLKKQRTTVEEIKQKTNYYTTRDLLQKYDETTISQSPLRQRLGPTPVLVPVTPQSVAQKPSNPMSPTSTPPYAPMAPPPFPSTPPRKQWYDKLADALLGDDDQIPKPAASRYALICERCFAHNGLVKESQWMDIQYVCPKCNHLNPSPRSRQQPQPSSPSNEPERREATRTSPARVDPVVSDDPPVVDGAEMEVDS